MSILSLVQIEKPPLDALTDFAVEFGGIAVYDLETSNFRNTWNFGITEYAALIVFPEGKKGIGGSLCNPGYPISQKAAEVTGIRDDMVRDALPWERCGGPFFSKTAEKVKFLVGYNNHRFDRGCVSEANERSGWYGAMFPLSGELDIFPFVSEVCGRKIKLGEALEVLKVEKPSDAVFHRAKGDVVATALLADCLLARFGAEKFLEKCSCSALTEKSREERAKREGSGEKNKTAFLPF